MGSYEHTRAIAAVPSLCRSARVVATVGVLIATVTLAAFAGWPSEARAQCSGQTCLPGIGYTFDVQWNCGLIWGSNSGALQKCWEPGNCISEQVAPACSHEHTFGWGSADYDGGGGVFVYIQTANYAWGSVDWNLARACALSNCNDTTAGSRLEVHHNGSTRHTIYGHGKA